ncbi:FAD:protein FMN transferase [candidate division KSB1 bacterium]
MKRIILAICLFFFLSCHERKEYPPVQNTQIYMDTYVTIMIFDRKFDEELTKRRMEKAFDEIGHLEKIGNVHSDSSELYFINERAGIEPVKISAELKNIINNSLKYCKMTDGAFDISVFPIEELWDFLAENPRIPDKEEIEERLPLVNFRNIVFNNNEIYFKIDGMGIDPGGFLKGYAIDRAVSILKDDGFRKFIVNMGGDMGIYVVDDDTATIKIQDPRDNYGFWGKFQINQGSVATSGDYERYFEIDGVRYHHIINPATGYPESDCVSVTIVTKEAELADAMATGIFVMGSKKGMDFINNNRNIEGVIICRDGGNLKSLISNGMVEKYRYMEF